MKKKSLLWLIPLSILMADTSVHKKVDLYPSEEKKVEAPWSRASVIKSVDEIDRARQKAIEVLRASIAKAERERDIRMGGGNDSQAVESTESKITESLSAADVTRAAASVEVAKARASTKIAKAVASVEKARNSLTQKSDGKNPELEKAKREAAGKIHQAIASVEAAKEKAAEQITKAGKTVASDKSRPAQKVLAYPNEALTVANGVSAVEIARSVSAVKISRAVSAVEITKTIADTRSPEPAAGTDRIHLERQRVPLEEVKAKAAASIANSIARVEVTKANALADMAKAVAIVKMAEIMDEQNREQYENGINLAEEAKKRGSSTYPQVLIKVIEKR